MQASRTCFFLILAGAALVCFFTPSRAAAQSELFTGVAVETAAATIRRDLETLLSQMEGSASRTMFDARSHLLVVIAQLDAIASKQQGVFWENLDRAERQFMLDASRLARSTTRDATKITADAQQVADTFESAIGRLLDQTPRLTRMSPSYALAGEGSRARVAFAGSFLLHGEPQLNLGKRPCTLTASLDTRLEFDCPLPAAASPASGQFVGGELTVFESRSWWQKLTFRSLQPRVVRTGLTLVGGDVGTLSIYAQGLREEVQERTRSQAVGHRNNHCQGDTHLNPSFTPESGCKVRVNSIQVSEQSRSSSSVNGGVRSVTDTGFQWSGIARNNGTCGPKILGTRVPVDARGSIHVEVSWIDVCRVQQPFEREIVETRGVRWGDAFAVPLPSGTKDVTYVLEGGVFGSQVGRSMQDGVVSIEISGGQALVRVGSVEQWLADR